MKKLIQGFDPIVGDCPQVLILGSMPSVASLSQQEYYGHPHNRFWKIVAAIYEDTFLSYQDKVACLHARHIALWDVIAVCEREGSLDSKIVNEEVNDILAFADRYPSIKTVICNGNKAGSLYRKKFAKVISLPYVTLPSTSPANASYRLDDLISVWKAQLPPKEHGF